MYLTPRVRLLAEPERGGRPANELYYVEWCLPYRTPYAPHTFTPRLENLTEAMTTGGRSAAGFGRSAAEVGARTRELDRYQIAMDSEVF